MLNGASIPDDVKDAWDDATELFNNYTPEEVADLKESDPDKRAEFIELVEILDDYNNGEIGPIHCSD